MFLRGDPAGIAGVVRLPDLMLEFRARHDHAGVLQLHIDLGEEKFDELRGE